MPRGRVSASFLCDSKIPAKCVSAGIFLRWCIATLEQLFDGTGIVALEDEYVGHGFITHACELMQLHGQECSVA